MRKASYQQMLQERVKKQFTIWLGQGEIKESELYHFLHNLEGTSGTIGMGLVSEFCTSQLAVLSVDNETSIPVGSLKNFMKRILELVDGSVDTPDFQLPETYRNLLDKETSILIIDDDLEFVSFVKELLEEIGAQVVIALNGKRGLDLFYSTRPHFVLIDLYLPDMSGFEVLDQIADVARARNSTIAITSVNKARENKVMAYERGAMDFITKPLDTDIFLSYIVNREEMRKLIDKSVSTDGLTGVGNRRHFDDMLDYFVENANRQGSKFSLIILDLDDFKKVNDTYGHPMGDEVLRKIGEVSNKIKRETDHVFRYGGEEFAFLLNGVNAEEAFVFAERLRKKFGEITFQKDSESFTVTFSAGIAMYEGDREKLIVSADRSLYRAKRSGRNQTIIFNPEDSEMKRKLHILVIDDDLLVRTILYEELSKWKMPDVDISVRIFSDGVSFLEENWYNSEDFFIILLDGIMPNMDGLEVLGHLKRNYEGKNFLVSMMTARVSESDKKSALQLGADDYIMKPFQPSDVVARIQYLTSRLFN
ncbi:diguanylate cyclase [Sporosarcina sp. CAU 1771]